MNRLDDSPPSANERVAKLRLQLRHRSLAELETREIVDYDRDAHLVKEGIHFSDAWTEV